MPLTPEQVRAIYEPTLIFPAEKRHPQFLLCPVGLIGAGKTTVTKPLAERLGLLRISGDEIRKILHDDGQGYDATFDIATGLFEKYLKEGYSVAIDSDCAAPHSREFADRAQREFGVRIIWVHVNPPEDFIINKLQNFKHSWLFKDSEEAIANYRARKLLHERLDMSFIYTFDTSRHDLPLQIDEAVQKIEALL